MKVALVHDYLREYGGAERVVEVLHEMYPEAPLYTAFVDWESLGEFGEKFRDWDIRTTWVDRNWLVKKYHSPLRFLTPLVWESLDLRGYDVVITSSGWYICRGVVTRPETLHISYIHHPPRNLYGFPTGTKPSRLVQAYATIINPFLRLYDWTAAQRVDYLIANSETTRERIKKFYRREAQVIYPPVEVRSSQFAVRSKAQKYLLSVGRLNFAKRVDLTIQACNKLTLPLKIVGTGREEASLKAMAGPTVEFLESVSDEELSRLYAGAKALIFCALQEDFGMVPVEAMAHGVPVIALRQGGVTETVVEGTRSAGSGQVTGVFFDEPTVESLLGAIEKFNKDYNHYNFYNACQAQAQKFSRDVFKKKMSAFVDEKYREVNDARS